MDYIDENLNPIKGLYNDLMTIVKNMVVKYSYLAEENETTESKSAADAYFDALYERDNFYTYPSYSEYDCKEAGITDSVIITRAASSPKTVPRSYQKALLKVRRKSIITSFEESNNYYRMLNGLPDITDETPVTLESYSSILSSYGINTSIPVHQIQDYYNNLQEGLGDYYMDVLDGLGIINELIEAYPDKEYLKFLGANKIDLFTARNAKNFEILRLEQPEGVKSIVYDTFITYYGQVRDYISATVFISQFRAFIDYYDKFIAMCITIMTINQVVVRQMQLGIRREFYDDYAIKLLYQAYDIPYNLDIDEEIQRGIVQNLNLLIQDKATNKVLYDIIALLGYSSFNVYKYFLVKQRMYDVYGLPLTIYTEKYDTLTGEYETVLDYDKMYDIYFQKVDLKETDIMNAFNKKSNKVEYDSITVPDPLWYEDTNLHNELYNSIYNFVETKYIGLGVSYSLTDLIFENILLMKMLMKKKDEIATITLSLPRIIEGIEVPLFDAIILLICLMAKKHHLKGEIISVPTQVIAVLDYLTNLDNGTTASYSNEEDDFGDLVSSVRTFLEDKTDDTWMADTFSFNFDNFIPAPGEDPPTVIYVTAQGRYYMENSDGTYTFYSKEGNVLKTGVSSSVIDTLLSEGELTIDIIGQTDPVTRFYTTTGCYFIHDDDEDRWEYYDQDDCFISYCYTDQDIMLGSYNDEEFEEIKSSYELTYDSKTQRYYMPNGNYYLCTTTIVDALGTISHVWGYYYPHDVEYMQLNGLLSKVVDLGSTASIITAIKPLIGLLEPDDMKKLLGYFSVLNVNSSSSNLKKIAAINSMYSNIKNLNTFLQYLMAKTTDKKTYMALRTFYRATFYSREMREVFYINTDETNGWLCYNSETGALIAEYSDSDTRVKLIDQWGKEYTFAGSVPEAIAYGKLLQRISGTTTRYYTEDGSWYFVYKGRPAKTYFEFLHWYNPKLYSAVFTIDERSQYSEYLANNGLSSSDFSYSEFMAAVSVGKIDLVYDTLANESGNEETNENIIFKAISHILTKLEEIIDNLGMLHLINDATTPLQDLLVKLVKFFKSYTVDLVSIDTILVCDLAAINTMKLIDDIEHIYKTIEIKDGFTFSYDDVLNRIISCIRTKDYLKFEDTERHNKKLGATDTVELRDLLLKISKLIAAKDVFPMSYSDVVSTLSATLSGNDKIKLHDSSTRIYWEDPKE